MVDSTAALWVASMVVLTVDWSETTSAVTTVERSVGLWVDRLGMTSAGRWVGYWAASTVVTWAAPRVVTRAVRKVASMAAPRAASSAGLSVEMSERQMAERWVDHLAVMMAVPMAVQLVATMVG